MAKELVRWMLLGFAIWVVLFYLIGGFDFFPRLRASGSSADGTWIVSVYEQRLFPGPFFPRMGAIVKIYDKDQNLVYEKTIFHDDDHDDTLGTSFNTVTFVGDEVHIGPGFYTRGKNFVINLAELRK